MLGVLTPQHLHRLGLINDSLLYTTRQHGEQGLLYNEVERHPSDQNHETADGLNDRTEGISADADRYNAIVKNSIYEEIEFTSDDVLLMKQALNKLPQIPFSLLIDEYRWKYFEGSLKPGFVNREFWAEAIELQGIAPIVDRGDQYFDIGAKFHVPDNTPYIR